MSEPSLHLEIQRTADDTEAKKFQREEEDQALISIEVVELNRLAVVFRNERNELQAEVSAMRFGVISNADTARQNMKISHLKEVKFLESNHKKNLESLESMKQLELTSIKQINSQRREDLNDAQMQKKMLLQNDFVLQRKNLAQRRKAEDDNTMRAWYQVLQENSGVWSSFSSSRSGRMVTSLPLGCIPPSEGPSNKHARADSTKFKGQRDVYLDSKGLISTGRPSKRQRNSPGNSRGLQSLVAVQQSHPKTFVQVEIPSFKPDPKLHKMTLQDKVAEQSGKSSDQALDQTCGQKSMIIEVPNARPFNPPTGPRNHYVRKDSGYESQPQLSDQKNFIVEMVPYVDRMPAPLKFYSVRYMSTNVSIFEKPTYRTASKETKFWLYYHAETLSFKPDNGGPCANIAPAFVISLKTIDRLEYNAEQTLVIVHRSSRRPTGEVKDGKIVKEVNGSYFSTAYIQFGGKDVTVDFVNVCKDKFPHIILKQLSGHLIKEKFKLQGWIGEKV